MTSPACYTRTLLLSTALALGTAAMSQASTFSWDFSGTIGAPQDVADPATAIDRASDTPGTSAATSGAFVHAGAGSSTLTWGDPLTLDSEMPVNSLTISSSRGSRSFADGETAEILLGWLTFTNKSVFHAGGTWYSTLSFDLEINSINLSPELRIKVQNTGDRTEGTDSASDIVMNNMTGLNPDFITFLNLTGLDAGIPFELGSGLWIDDYSVRISAAGDAGTRPDGATGDVCSFGGFGSQLVGATWANCEGNVSMLGLFANVRYSSDVVIPTPEPTISPVPLPAAGWLLIAGLAGLGALRVRRETAA